MKKYALISTNFLFIALLNNTTLQAKEVQHNMRVDGITCPFCVATSAKELKKIDGVIHIGSDLKNGIIKVCSDESVQLTDEALTELFLNKGFTYKGKETIDTCDAR